MKNERQNKDAGNESSCNWKTLQHLRWDM